MHRDIYELISTKQGIVQNQSWARDNFLASRQRQRNYVTEPQGPVRDQKKIQKIFSPQCLDGVVTTKIVK